MGSSSARSVPTVAHTSQQPANDAPRTAQPRALVVLGDAELARLSKAALALPTAQVRPLPAYVGERVRHMGVVFATARRDREALASVDLGDRSVTARDVEEFGARVQFVSEVLARRAVRSIRLGLADPARLSNAELHAAMRKRRATLCAALILRFEGSAATLREVRAIRGNRRASQHGGCNLSLFDICGDPSIAAWLRALPRGEGAALDALRELHAEWKDRQDAPPRPDGEDLVRRAYALACASLGRVVAVGRYLVADVPERAGDYAGFARPKRAARVAKPAPVVDAPKPA